MSRLKYVLIICVTVIAFSYIIFLNQRISGLLTEQAELDQTVQTLQTDINDLLVERNELVQAVLTAETKYSELKETSDFIDLTFNNDNYLVIDKRLPPGLIETFFTHRRALEIKDIELYKTTISKSCPEYARTLGYFQDGSWVTKYDINDNDHNYLEALDAARYMRAYGPGEISFENNQAVMVEGIGDILFYTEDGKWLIADIH